MPSARRKVRRAAVRMQKSTLLHLIARAGFAVNGLLHVTMGGIAFAVAFGEKGAANHEGALHQLGAGPVGGVLLWAAVIALWGLACFQALTAALVRGTDRQAWNARARPGFRALAYLGLGAIAFRFVTGNAPEGSEAQQLSQGLLHWVGGQWAVGAIGVAIFAAGVVFVAIGIRRRFLADIDPPNALVRRTARIAGVVGYTSKGVALTTVGVLFTVAAIMSDARDAAGLDGALETLRRLPLGNLVLSVVALGFVLFGLYCFIRAWRERLEQPTTR